MWEEKGEGRIGAGCGHACGAAYVETVGVVLQRTPRLISPYTVCPLPPFPYPGLTFVEQTKKRKSKTATGGRPP